MVSLVIIEEFREERTNDVYCKSLRAKIFKGSPIEYIEDERGLLVRVAPVDGAVPIFVPEMFYNRAFHLPNNILL